MQSWHMTSLISDYFLSLRAVHTCFFFVVFSYLYSWCIVILFRSASYDGQSNENKIKLHLAASALC